MALQSPVLDLFLDGQILAPTSPFHLLISDAYRYFLGYPRAIEHLAKMTLESSRINTDLDDVEERVQDIKKYLSTHFPAVGQKMLAGSYGSTHIACIIVNVILFILNNTRLRSDFS
jgi:hypothetical protein